MKPRQIIMHLSETLSLLPLGNDAYLAQTLAIQSFLPLAIIRERQPDIKKRMRELEKTLRTYQEERENG